MNIKEEIVREKKHIGGFYSNKNLKKKVALQICTVTQVREVTVVLCLLK